VFDSLMQLYQKGSLSIDFILDLFNIDSEDVRENTNVTIPLYAAMPLSEVTIPFGMAPGNSTLEEL